MTTKHYCAKKSSNWYNKLRARMAVFLVSACISSPPLLNSNHLLISILKHCRWTARFPSRLLPGCSNPHKPDNFNFNQPSVSHSFTANDLLQKTCNLPAKWDRHSQPKLQIAIQKLCTLLWWDNAKHTRWSRAVTIWLFYKIYTNALRRKICDSVPDRV